MAVPLEHEAAATKSIGNETIRASGDIAALDFQNPVGVGQVPILAVAARFEAGEH